MHIFRIQLLHDEVEIPLVATCECSGLFQDGSIVDGSWCHNFHVQRGVAHQLRNPLPERLNDYKSAQRQRVHTVVYNGIKDRQLPREKQKGDSWAKRCCFESCG